MSDKARLDALEHRLNYKFKDRELLIRALTHGSYGDGRRKIRDNERLEFLGDRVLGLLTAELLFHNCPEEEGGLARRLNTLVRKETCAAVARQVDLGAALRLSRSVAKHDGRQHMSILGDACEALMAAIYMDGGWDAIKAFYLQHWRVHIDKVLGQSGKDPKTELQERAARFGMSAPVYELMGRGGPDHRPVFITRVAVSGVGDGEGQGTSKKASERAAAAALLQNWPSQDNNSAQDNDTEDEQ